MFKIAICDDNKFDMNCPTQILLTAMCVCFVYLLYLYTRHMSTKLVPMLMTTFIVPMAIALLLLPAVLY